MDRRALLAALATTGGTALAGCASIVGGPTTVDAGDRVALDGGDVSVGELGVRHSFLDDTSAPPTVHGATDQVFVTLRLGLSEYDGAYDDLPVRLAVDDDRVVPATNAYAAGTGDGAATIAFPVPATPDAETARLRFDASDRERHYPLDDPLIETISDPGTWTVTADYPDSAPRQDPNRVWVTATHDNDTPGALDTLLTHDNAPELHWDHTFTVDPDTDDAQFGYPIHCLCTDRDELTVRLDWGLDAIERTVTVPDED